MARNSENDIEVVINYNDTIWIQIEWVEAKRERLEMYKKLKKLLLHQLPECFYTMILSELLFHG